MVQKGLKLAFLDQKHLFFWTKNIFAGQKTFFHGGVEGKSLSKKDLGEWGVPPPPNEKNPLSIPSESSFGQIVQ